MMIAGRLGGRFDQRKLMALGLLVLSWSLWSMSGWTPDVPERTLILTIIIQGFGMGMVFNPLSVMAFTTLAPQLRGDGAALLSLFRNIGSAIGVSVTSFSLARNTQVSHADLAALATPFNRALQGNGAVSHFLNPATVHGAEMFEAMIGRQAQIIAYNDDYLLMTCVTLPTLLLLLLMRKPRGAAAPPADAHAALD